jgi:ferritin-like metal-binding protein YciE
MALNTLNDVLVDQVSDLYDAEQQLVEALPKMSQAAHADELREALQMHLEQTRNHVRRLEQIFQKLGMSPTIEHCEGMEGLIREGGKVMKAKGDPVALDAALIAEAQRVEHYEIAGYGTARTLANELGMGDVSDLLNETLDEESAADSKLTKIATGGMFRSGINEQAAGRS